MNRRTSGRRRDRIVSGLVGLVGLGVAVCCATPAAAWDGRDRLASGAPVTWSGGAIALPTDGPDAWMSAREAAGVPAAEALLAANLGVGALLGAVEALVDEGHLAWDVAWIAAGAAEGAWSDAQAARWVEALTSVSTAGAVTAEDRQRLAALSFASRGSALGAVAPRCLPTEPAALAALDAFVAFELAVPETRVGAPDEASASLPVALTPAASLARAVASLTTAHPDESASLDPGCGGGVAMLLAGAVRWTPSEAAEQAEALRFAATVGPVPERVVQRIAVHAYLRTDAALLDVLRDVEALQGRGAGPTAARLDALRAGAAQDRGAMIAGAGALDGQDPLARWIRAEAARMDGQWDEALRLVDGLIDEDPGFVGAILTRASAHLHRGTAELALADLVYLRQRWSGEPLYAAWIDRLGAALAARAR